MTPLRQQMIDAMRQRGFSVHTHQSYLYAVNDLARHYRRSPEQLSVDELQDYSKHLVIERSLSGATCRVYFWLLSRIYGWMCRDFCRELEGGGAGPRDTALRCHAFRRFAVRAHTYQPPPAGEELTAASCPA